jgi:hypothetical protein
MPRVIGVFDTQEQAIEAVQGLEKAGFRRERLHVLAKDYESSRRVENETDVHVDEINDLVDTREDSGEGPLNTFAGSYIGGAGVSPVVAAAGLSTYNASTIFPSGAFAWTSYPEGEEMSSALHALGVGDQAGAICTEALNEGRFLVAAEIGQDEAERQSAAEEVMRGCGARELV